MGDQPIPTHMAMLGHPIPRFVPEYEILLGYARTPEKGVYQRSVVLAIGTY